MAVNVQGKRAYGMRSPLVSVAADPIVATRVPTTADRAEIGQVWIYQNPTGTDDAYVLTSIVNNVSYWLNTGGGSGTFDSVTVNPDDLTVTAGDAIITAGDLEVTAGDVTIGSFATAGVVVNDASGVLSTSASTDGHILVASTGAAPVWTSLTCGDGSIVIAEGAGTLDITATGATASSYVTQAGGPALPLVGALTISGYDANITTDGATANTVKVRLADNITSVGSITATNDLTMSAGTLTVTSDDNNANAIYLHANGGVNETINIYSDQGTGVASINMHSDVGGLTLASGLASADAINITASNAAGGIDVDFGTGGLSVVGANGAVNIESGTGAINIGADAAAHTVTVGSTNTTARTIIQSGSGDVTVTSTDKIELDCAGTLELNSSAGIIGIGNDAVAQNINIGTGAADRVVTVGNSSGASQVVVDCGTAGLDLGVSATEHTTRLGSTNAASATTLQSGTGAFTVTAGGILDVNVAGAVTIDSSGSTISIGNDAVAQNMNIGTGAAERIITIGNATNATQVVLNSGTASVEVGTNAVAHAVNLGSITGTAATTLRSGTGAFTVTAGGAFDANVAGAVTIDSSGGTISIGNDAVAQNMNIGTGAAARVITIGNVTDATQVVLNSGTAGISMASTGAGDITANSSDALLLDAAGVLELNSSAGVIGIGNDAVAQNINIGTGAAARVITIGNVTDATQVVLNSGTAGISMASTGAGDIVIDSDNTLLLDADGVLELNSSAGAISIGNDANAQAINIGTGAAARTLTVGNTTAGSSVILRGGAVGNIKVTPATNSAAGAAITLDSKVGVVTLTGLTTAAAASETLTITNSEVSATSGILVSVSDAGAADAQLTIQRVKPGAGSFVVIVKNNGAASLNGDIIVSWIVLN
jgi:hypothetical protein